MQLIKEKFFPGKITILPKGVSPQSLSLPKIISVDPSFRHTGWIIFQGGNPVDWGIIHTEKTDRKNVRVGDDDANNCKFITKSLSDIISDNNIQAIVCELASGSISARAAKSLAYTLAIIAAVSTLYDLPIEFVPQNSWKKDYFGRKNVSKEEIMNRIRSIFPQCDFPKANANFEHIADAAGIYLSVKGTSNIIRMFKG